MSSIPAETCDWQTVARGICGAAHARLDGGNVTVEPADATQAGELLAMADAEEVAVTIEGGKTKQRWLVPPGPGLTLRTRRMDKVVEHVWQDMTCTVQAGCTWSALQTALARHGQFVALDPLWPERATVGGVIAANDSGALRLRYGGLRDLLIGMTVVLADGAVTRSGGKVVKNVAGYDLPKLLCGSFGTLALIAEATFRLHSVARHSADYTLRASRATDLAKPMALFLRSHLSLASLQVRAEESGAALDVRLSSMPEVLTRQHAELSAVAQDANLELCKTDVQVWSERQRICDLSTSRLVFKASVLPSAIAGILEAAVELGGSAVAQGTGLITGAVPLQVTAGLMELRKDIEKQGGSLVLIGLPDDRQTIDRWGALPSAWELMRSVKSQFDPHSILNPGRFVGGI